jgi:hypothetical protein
MNIRGIHKLPFDLQSCPLAKSTMTSSPSAAGESPAQTGTTGNISSVFELKAPESIPRFAELKKTMWKDSMIQSWAQVLDVLKEKAEQVGLLGSKAGDSVKHLSFVLKPS